MNPDVSDTKFMFSIIIILPLSMDVKDSDQMSDFPKSEDHRAASSLGHVTLLKWNGHCCLTPGLRMAGEDKYLFSGFVRCFPAPSQSADLFFFLFSFPFFEFEQKCKEHQVPVHQAPGKYLNLVLKIKKVIFQISKEEMPIGKSSFQWYLRFLTKNVFW